MSRRDMFCLIIATDSADQAPRTTRTKVRSVLDVSGPRRLARALSRSVEHHSIADTKRVAMLECSRIGRRLHWKGGQEVLQRVGNILKGRRLDFKAKLEPVAHPRDVNCLARNPDRSATR